MNPVCCISEQHGCPKEKRRGSGLSSKLTQVFAFSTDQHFDLKEQLTDNTHSDRNLDDIFSKLKKIRLLLSREITDNCLLSMIKFMQIGKFWKTCICHCEQNSFLILKDCSGEINDGTNVGFWGCFLHFVKCNTHQYL